MTPPPPKLLSDPLVLPCGVCLPNRFAKAAMTEGLATPDGISTHKLNRLYGLWAAGGCGLLISGNIQIDRNHLERPGNVILHNGLVENTDALEALKEWTKAGTLDGKIHFWAQISHAGRQVQFNINPSPKAPSAVKVRVPLPIFRTPQALTISEIQHIIKSFGQAAKTCQKGGFTGIQIHAAHGYLLSSFLNPRANQRTDEYGGCLANRARILLEVVRTVRQQVGPKFPVSVKLNSADFQKGGFQFTDSLQVVQWLEKASVDLIEISGGNYEQGVMVNMLGMEPLEEQNVNKAPSTKAREAYFLEFAKAMQELVTVPLMVTGGFRSKEAMEYALESGSADIIGLGRPLCVMTDGAKQLLEGKIDALPKYEDHLDLISPTSRLAFLKKYQVIKVVDSAAKIFWFYEQLESLASSGKTIPNLGTFQAVKAVEIRNRKLLAGRTKGITANNKSNTSAIGAMISCAIAVALIAVAVTFGAGYLIKSHTN